MKTLPKFAIAASVIGLVASPALAEPDVHTKSIVVDISAYNLDTVAGATEAHRILKSAAKRVCRISLGPKSVRERLDEEACEAKAIEDAVKSTRSPQLARVHQSLG